jgi:hypothetical protein
MVQDHTEYKKIEKTVQGKQKEKAKTVCQRSVHDATGIQRSVVFRNLRSEVTHRRLIWFKKFDENNI